MVCRRGFGASGAGRKQIQERLIEVPKVVPGTCLKSELGAEDWVERVEYEDYVEYREVPVDKVIEVWLMWLDEILTNQVPEIEYKIKQVDHTVPQTYIQVR